MMRFIVMVWAFDGDTLGWRFRAHGGGSDDYDAALLGQIRDALALVAAGTARSVGIVDTTSKRYDKVFP